MENSDIRSSEGVFKRSFILRLLKPNVLIREEVKMASKVITPSIDPMAVEIFTRARTIDFSLPGLSIIIYEKRMEV